MRGELATIDVIAGIQVVGSLVNAEGGSARNVGGIVEVARHVLVGVRPALLQVCSRSMRVKVLSEASVGSRVRKKPGDGVPSGRGCAAVGQEVSVGVGCEACRRGVVGGVGSFGGASVKWWRIEARCGGEGRRGLSVA
jgi:hypothetical protein